MEKILVLSLRKESKMEQLAVEMKASMSKSIDALKANFNTLRTGRASVSILDNVLVDYYGDKMPLNNIALLSIPDPRQIVIKPYDRNDLKAIAGALNASDIGINPIVESDLIRLIIPGLTEERRRELVKKAKQVLEEAKVAVRNIRRDSLDLLKKDDSYSDDYKKRIEKDFETVTSEILSVMDNLFSQKEKEIMTV